MALNMSKKEIMQLEALQRIILLMIHIRSTENILARWKDFFVTILMRIRLFFYLMRNIF